jgi:ribosomal protein S18 acetylase RimI-like enzyme
LQDKTKSFLMRNVLKNPAWNALNTGNKNLSNGTDRVKYFSPDVSPFAGLVENSQENFEVLFNITPFDSPISIFSNEELVVPEYWKVTRRIHGLQMIYKKADAPVVNTNEIVPLNEKNVPQMLQLTRLTNPGPFVERTISFGNYKGIFDGERLVAMAGWRLHINDYIEISAVCTLPTYTGRGYARQLMINQIHKIHEEGCIPFLHVRSDNTRAINVYKNLGFERGEDITIFIIEKSK